jgi:hypothetical protein
MNIIIPYENFEYTNIFFLEKRQTNFRALSKDNEKWQNLHKSTSGNYTKIIYSTKYFTMNGIYLSFPIIPSVIHKNYITITNTPPEFMMAIHSIESVCLSYYADFFSIEKQAVYHLASQLISGNIKYYRENHGSRLYLKITGIWDTEIEYGITYKIIMA